MSPPPTTTTYRRPHVTRPTFLQGLEPRLKLLEMFLINFPISISIKILPVDAYRRTDMMKLTGDTGEHGRDFNNATCILNYMEFQKKMQVE